MRTAGADDGLEVEISATNALHPKPSGYYPRPCKTQTLLGWRNWYTRKTKDLVPKGLRVRVPSRAPLFEVQRVTIGDLTLTEYEVKALIAV